MKEINIQINLEEENKQNKDRAKNIENIIVAGEEIPEDLKKSFSQKIDPSIKIEYLSSCIFTSEEVRNSWIKELFFALEKEKKRRIKECCSFKFSDLKGKDLKYILWYLISIPLDWYTFFRFFNLMKKVAKNIIELCDLNLKEEYFNKELERLKKDCQKVKFLDKVITDYCDLDYPYYQELIDIFEKRFLHYQNNIKADRIIENIRAVMD